jgi:hypothetical protein
MQGAVFTMLKFTATVVPDQASGPYRQDSYAELVQRAIKLPGLDPAWTHTLVQVVVAADGFSADLTVVSTPPAAAQMVDGLRLDYGSPTAAVRVFDAAGQQLSEGQYPAPLQVGQTVWIGDTRYQVVSEDHPGRAPETGVCTGDIDWQHVVVSPPMPAIVAAPTSA